MVEDKITTIKLRGSTREKLAEQGKKGESYDEILNKLLDIMKEKEQCKRDGNR
ncbi:MAG: hypothetical protein NTY48_02125 [Candidatus Diapherotrites archaeon]|nr:hypothetical protein [Candidatus Diapherotrites archaeon]